MVTRGQDVSRLWGFKGDRHAVTDHQINGTNHGRACVGQARDAHGVVADQRCVPHQTVCPQGVADVGRDARFVQDGPTKSIGWNGVALCVARGHAELNTVIGGQFEGLPGRSSVHRHGSKVQHVQVTVSDHHRNRSGERRAFIKHVGGGQAVGIRAGQDRPERGCWRVDVRQRRLFGPRGVRQTPVGADAPAVAFLVNRLHAGGQRIVRRDFEVHVVDIGRIDHHGQMNHGALADRDRHRGGERPIPGFDDLRAAGGRRPHRRLTFEDASVRNARPIAGRKDNGETVSAHVNPRGVEVNQIVCCDAGCGHLQFEGSHVAMADLEVERTLGAGG